MYSKVAIFVLLAAIVRGSNVGHSSFSYGVHDPHTGDVKDQHETRVGDRVVGQYSLLESDGTKRIVDYEANPHTGFSAVVRKHGVAAHPARYAASPLAYANYKAAATYANYAAAPAYATYAAGPVYANYAAAPTYANYGAAPAYASYGVNPAYANYAVSPVAYTTPYSGSYDDISYGAHSYSNVVSPLYSGYSKLGAYNGLAQGYGYGAGLGYGVRHGW